MLSTHDYSKWTNEELVKRVTSLEAQLRSRNASFTPQDPVEACTKTHVSTARQFSPAKYSSRRIALKLAYLGQRYNGFEHHANNSTPLPTIEEELWKALSKTKLIFPTSTDDYSWEGCEYSKCGRTDKGVSAFGQVIGLRVRSAKPKVEEDDVQGSTNEFDEVRDELPYARILNRVLPEDIRVLAWCPAPSSEFSARFSCKERQYRYFFTQPAFYPIPGAEGSRRRRNGKTLRDGWLDIPAMREAAQQFIGLHDFRNFCKVDPARQITNFERRIFFADIQEYNFFHGNFSFSSPGEHSPSEFGQGYSPQVFCFTVYGSAFLWHQIRHMVAILFLVGQGLEDPSIVSKLLDVETIREKPTYEMATDAPLVLWDCIFPSENDSQRMDALEWVYTDSDVETESYKRTSSAPPPSRFGSGSISDVLWSGWRNTKIDEVLAGSLLECITRRMQQQNGVEAEHEWSKYTPNRLGSERVFDGGNGPRLKGVYVPVLDLKRTETPAIVNARYLERKPAAARFGSGNPPSTEPKS